MVSCDQHEHHMMCTAHLTPSSCLSHLLHVVKVQQQGGMALETVGVCQQRREAILMRQEVLTCGVPAQTQHIPLCQIVLRAQHGNRYYLAHAHNTATLAGQRKTACEHNNPNDWCHNPRTWRPVGLRSSTVHLQASCLVGPSCVHHQGVPAAFWHAPASHPSWTSTQENGPGGGKERGPGTGGE